MSPSPSPPPPPLTQKIVREIEKSVRIVDRVAAAVGVLGVPGFVCRCGDRPADQRVAIDASRSRAIIGCVCGRTAAYRYTVLGCGRVIIAYWPDDDRDDDRDFCPAPPPSPDWAEIKTQMLWHAHRDGISPRAAKREAKTCMAELRAEYEATGTIRGWEDFIRRSAVPMSV